MIALAWAALLEHAYRARWRLVAWHRARTSARARRAAFARWVRSVGGLR